jgi:hypothetical protein
MKRMVKRWWIWVVAVGAIAAMLAALMLGALAGTNDDPFVIAAYSDVVRFGLEGAASLQVQVFDLSGRVVWDSGRASVTTVDWDRRSDSGEQLAYGVYLYRAQGWGTAGDLIAVKNGRVALLPNDKVQLQSAPAVTPSVSDAQSPTNRPMTIGNTSEQLVGGTLQLGANAPAGGAERGRIQGYMRFDVSGSFFRAVPDGTPFLIEGFGEPYNYAALVSGTSPTSVRRSIALFTGDSASGNLTLGMYVAPDGRVGVGTGSVSARLTVQDSTGQDLIAAYSGASRVFQVTSSGEVRADGAFRGASFNTGSADVAERINTSEWVEAGNVVEIDPDHPGFFRKSTGTYSRRVAGIISEEPGVILGNNSGSQEEWDDSRPALALAGRVRVLASVENGPIRVGDLLTSSSEPGVAMRATDPAATVGAVVGKAMEELTVGTARIMVQVMLH